MIQRDVSMAQAQENFICFLSKPPGAVSRPGESQGLFFILLGSFSGKYFSLNVNLAKIISPRGIECSKLQQRQGHFEVERAGPNP